MKNLKCMVKYNFIIFIMVLFCTNHLYSQILLHSESFETDGEGTRYTSNTYSYCPADPDYFFRTNTNPVLPAGCSAGFNDMLTNIQGSYFWAGEDIKSNQAPICNRAPGQITTQNITIAGYTSLQVSLFLATSFNNIGRWEFADSINIQASIDGGPFRTVGRFMGSDAVANGNLIIDANLNGVYDAGSEATPLCNITNMTKYTFNIPGTGSNINIRIDFDQCGGSEESAIDLIELVGTPSPCVNPTVPSVNASPSTVCTGGSSTLSITGTLNNATAWKIYTGSCGGTLLGMTSGTTFMVSPGSTTTYYVRGEGGCVTPGSCGTATVNVSSPMVLTCPSNTMTTSCQSQGAVNAAFTAWLATASASGGSNGVLTNNNTGAPSACGGSTTVTFTYTSTCAPFMTTCQATFTVPASPTVVFTCPTNTTTGACQTQGAVNAAFAAWLATASAMGGCNGVLTNNNTGAPSACGGSTTVTFTYTSTCAPFTTTCQATFAVPSAPTIVLTCPTNTTTAACQTQSAVNAAFATWLATASASGGCNGVLTNNNTGAPSACGGSTTVTFTYTSTCAPLMTTCQATHTVPSPPIVVFSCPTNTSTAAGQTQSQVNAAFAAWLGTASGSGGCNGVLTNNNTGAPPATGGSTTVTFTYNSTCAPVTTTCQATFTVLSIPPVVLTCPINTTSAACQTQGAVNAAFTTWLSTASASGGCNGVLTNNNTGAPSACGGSTTVTFTYTSTCAPLTTTCQATFTVTASPPVGLSCPTNTTTAACQTQSAVNTAFATWLSSANASGGCNGVLTNNNTGAPSACGGSTTMTFTYTNNCAPLTTTCQATFTVTASPPVVLTCPTNTTIAACQTQSAVNTAFTTWLSTANASGGCNGVLTNNNTGAPSACGGSTTVTFTYTSTCAPLITTCQATFTVPSSPTVVLTCPTNSSTAAGQTQSQVNAAFATWLGTASGSGGCNGVLTNNNVGAPPATGGSTTVTFTYTSTCAPLTTTCQATFTVLTGLFQNMQTTINYMTLQGAIDAATPGQTIVLLGDVSESDVNVTNSIIIDANGFTLTIPTGNLTIPSGRSLTWSSSNLIIAPGANIVNNGTLKNNGIIDYNNATPWINAGLYDGRGTFNGSMTNNGTFAPGN